MVSKEQRRTDILNAALKVFAQNGFDRATIAEIAELAGIGKGTVYEYFKSKKELFEDMIRHSVETYNKKLQNAVTKGNSVQEKLINFSIAHSEFMEEHIDILRMLPQPHMMSEEMKQHMVQEKYKVFKLIESLIQEGIESGLFRKDLDKEITAFCIIGAVNEHYCNRVFMNKGNSKELHHAILINTLVEGFINR